MLYNVAIYASPHRVVPVPLKVEAGQDVPLRVLNARGQNAVEAAEQSLYHAIVGAGMVGQMVYDPLDLSNKPTVGDGLYGVPLWLSETSLRGPRSPGGMDKVWMASPTPAFESVAIYPTDQFPRSTRACRMPGAAFARMAQGGLAKDIQAQLAYTHPDELIEDLNDDQNGPASGWVGLGVSFHPLGSGGVSCVFPDGSALEIGAGGQRLNVFDMGHHPCAVDAVSSYRQ